MGNLQSLSDLKTLIYDMFLRCSFTVARQTYIPGLLILCEKCAGHKGFAYSETLTPTIIPVWGTGLLLANMGKKLLLYSEISQGNDMPDCFTQALKNHFEITQHWNIKITIFSLHLESTYRARAKGMSTMRSQRYQDGQSYLFLAVASKRPEWDNWLCLLLLRFLTWWNEMDIFSRFLNKWHLT